VTHGEAVSAGMMIAIAFSEKRGLLPKADLIRIENLLKKLGLPTCLSVNRHKIMDAIRKDKKRSGDEIYFVLLNGIGSAIVERIFIHELENEALALLQEN
jgi:3-dehydroquinate synthase